jgi:hypothetical protein
LPPFPVQLPAAVTAADAASQYQSVLRSMEAALDRYDALKGSPQALSKSY